MRRKSRAVEINAAEAPRSGVRSVINSVRSTPRQLIKAAFGQVLAQTRATNEMKRLCRHRVRRVHAPFGPSTTYVHVRRLLDPVRHKHLLGTDPHMVEEVDDTEGEGEEPAAVTPPSTSPTTAQEPQGHIDESVPLPSGKEIAALPLELAETLRSVARDRLMTYFVPRLFVRRKLLNRKANNAMHLKLASRPSVEALKHFAVFSSWSADALSDAINAMTYFSVEAGELLLYEGEPAGGGILCVTFGTCEVVKRRIRKVKQVGGSNAMHVATLQSTFCPNEFCFLNAEARCTSVRALQRCDVWCLSRGSFEKGVATLNAAERDLLREKATEERLATMQHLFPIDEEELRRNLLFQNVSSGFIDAALQCLKPLAVQSGFKFCQSGAVAEGILFFRQGRVGVYRVINGVETHVGTVPSPVVLLHDNVVLHQPVADTLKGLTDCDAYVLSADDVEAALMTRPADRTAMVTAARSQQLQRLSVQHVRFRPLMYNIPILRELATIDQLHTLAYLFEGKVYAPLSLVCSASEMCDRVLILQKGAVSFGPRGRWAVGDAIGFTCVVPHRWACAAVALDAVECIEIPSRLFIAFLKDIGAFKKYTDIVNVLLFPRAYPPCDVDAVQSKHLSQYETPPTYPISDNEVRNATDRGFVPSRAVSSLDSKGGAADQLLMMRRGKLSKREAVEVMQSVSQNFHPEEHRKLIKLTPYFWVKAKGRGGF